MFSPKSHALPREYKKSRTALCRRSERAQPHLEIRDALAPRLAPLSGPYTALIDLYCFYNLLIASILQILLFSNRPFRAIRVIEPANSKRTFFRQSL